MPNPVHLLLPHFHFTGVYFRGEFYYVGYVGYQKIKSWLNRTRNPWAGFGALAKCELRFLCGHQITSHSELFCRIAALKKFRKNVQWTSPYDPKSSNWKTKTNFWIIKS